MMFQVFKSAVGHSIFGECHNSLAGAVNLNMKKIAMSDSQAFCVCFLLSLFFKYHEC